MGSPEKSKEHWGDEEVRLQFTGDYPNEYLGYKLIFAGKSGISAEKIAQYPPIQTFSEYTTAKGVTFEVTDPDLEAVIAESDGLVREANDARDAGNLELFQSKIDELEEVRKKFL